MIRSLRITRRAFPWSILLVIQTAVAFAQQPSAEAGPDQNEISFGPAVGMAGQEISLPLYLYIPAEAKIGRLAMELTFPVAALTFVRTETAYPAEQVGAKISAEVAESMVRVQVAVPEDSKDGLPQGSIAFIVFKVSDDAPGGKLEVLAENVEMMDLNDQPLAGAAKSAGEIDVIPKEMEPLFACFFYMH